MEYKIISGRTTEIRRTMMPFREKGQKVRRGTRVKGKTSLRKILANEREAVKNLARILNCNFGPGDCWITLTYPENILPASREEAKKDLEKFLRKCRDAYRKATGEALRYVVSVSDRDGKTGEIEKRLHLHIVMDAVAYEIITALWPAEDVTYRRLDGRGDYIGIARYMVSNAGPADGKKRWSTSKGLRKPIITEPVPVEAKERIRIPRDVSLKEREEYRDDETGMFSAYVRFTRLRDPAASPANSGSMRERRSSGMNEPCRVRSGRTI